MSHQYFLQNGDGSRVSITQEQANVLDLNKEYFRLISTAMMTVYRKHGRTNMSPEPKLHYGGRVNHRNPNGWRGC